MGFKKEELCPMHEECILLNDEKRANRDAVNQLSGIDYVFETIGFVVDNFVASLGDLLLEVKYNLYKSIKVLAPEFPWEDPLSEDEIEEEPLEDEITKPETPQKKEETIYNLILEKLGKLVL